MKSALVTGASSGIGREFVFALAKNVDLIYVVARRAERLQELQQQVEVPCVPLCFDLSLPSSIEKLGEKLKNDGADLSVLVNCAGFAKLGPFGQAGNLAMIDLNVRALVAVTELAVPFMHEGASIVQVASTAAFQPLPGMNVYAASKVFVLSYARALSRELAERGICVTALCPGWTKTEFLDIAQQGADKNTVHKMPFMTTPEFVVKCAMRAIKKRRGLCVPGLLNKAHFFFSKIIPSGTIMDIWELMR
ncbi:MAG TPA: short-chain dehydrogenase [Clostridiales bacterium]|nr:short-chain dehydrogenase [Clostridiales bacterium]